MRFLMSNPIINIKKFNFDFQTRKRKPKGGSKIEPEPKRIKQEIRK